MAWHAANRIRKACRNENIELDIEAGIEFENDNEIELEIEIEKVIELEIGIEIWPRRAGSYRSNRNHPCSGSDLRAL